MNTTLNIGGKERPLKFSQLALELFAKNSDWENRTDAGYVYAILYAGLYAAAKAKGLEIDFTFEQVCDWTDMLYASGATAQIKAACDTFADTQHYKKWMHDLQDKIRQLQQDAEEPDEEEKKSVA